MPPGRRVSATAQAGKFTQIERRSTDARNLRSSHELVYQSSGKFPQPLTIRSSLLTSSITVVTWRKAHGLGDTLEASKWGMVAIASAQIGYQTSSGGVLPLTDLSGAPEVKYDDGTTNQTVRVLGSGADSKYRNLFFSDDPKVGVRFGARLVPIGSANTYHPDLADKGKAVDDLLKSGSTRWLTSSGKLGGTYPTALKELEEIVKVDTSKTTPDQALRAFWH
jgi:hypothetical protein